MKEEIKKEWIKRLRSGAIKQGYGKLGTTAGYRIPLGVLCDIAVDHGVIDKPGRDGPDMGGGSTLVYGDDVGPFKALPIEVCEWADIHPYGKIEGDPHNRSIKEANNRLSFSETADLIESSVLAGYSPEDLPIEYTKRDTLAALMGVG